MPRIVLSSAQTSHYRNDIFSTFVLRECFKNLDGDQRNSFEKFQSLFSEYFPLTPNKSEDEVMLELLQILKSAGWQAKDCRSTFLPGTDLKPDIWVNARKSFFEAMNLKTSLNLSAWTTHCERTVSYSRQARSQTAFCTDGRRWFVASTKDGEVKVASIDTKLYARGSEELTFLLLMVWCNGPLFSQPEGLDLAHLSYVSKKIFKKHILASAAKLDDRHKEYFGLLAAGAYALYNGIDLLGTRALKDAVHAFSTEHWDVGIAMVKKYFRSLKDANVPGLSDIANRVLPLVEKHPDIDRKICCSILIDHQDHPLSWETFDADDLSEVYETLLGKSRQKFGIFATPRDLCGSIVAEEFRNLPKDKNYGSLVIVDPCCGSGTFLEQAAKYIGNTLMPPHSTERRPLLCENLYFLGQDVNDLATAITIIVLYVACLRHLWHLLAPRIEMDVSTGNTMDRRSPLFRRADTIRHSYTMVFGNPPFVRAKSVGRESTGLTGNMLYTIAEKSMSLCNPGSLTFVLPAHVKGGDASKHFDAIPLRHSLRLEFLWHLPEMKIFRGCAETRHIVASWRPDTRPNAKVLVYTPPPKGSDDDLSSCLKKSANSKALQFTTMSHHLADIPFYSSLYASDELKSAFSSCPRLRAWKDGQKLTIVQGIMESHPYVPSAYNRSRELTPIGKIIQEEKLTSGDPIFVLDKQASRRMAMRPERELTTVEKRHFRLHAKSEPSKPMFRYPKQANRVLFCDDTVGAMSEDEFMATMPHFYLWLRPFHKLLLADKDRSRGALKWWQLHRSASPRPNARKKPGIDFANEKVLASQFLSRDIWCWSDKNGHIASGSGFNCVSLFPKSDCDELREDWSLTLTCWLNSYLIRHVWLKILGHCKARGAGGEVQVNHLASIPVPECVLEVSTNKTAESMVGKLSELGKLVQHDARKNDLISIDIICWKILELASGKSIGTPQTRDGNDDPLEATA